MNGSVPGAPAENAPPIFPAVGYTSTQRSSRQPRLTVSAYVAPSGSSEAQSQSTHVSYSRSGEAAPSGAARSYGATRSTPSIFCRNPQYRCQVGRFDSNVAIRLSNTSAGTFDRESDAASGDS